MRALAEERRERVRGAETDIALFRCVDRTRWSRWSVRQRLRWGLRGRLRSKELRLLSDGRERQQSSRRGMRDTCRCNERIVERKIAIITILLRTMSLP